MAEKSFIQKNYATNKIQKSQNSSSSKSLNLNNSENFGNPSNNNNFIEVISRSGSGQSKNNIQNSNKIIKKKFKDIS